METRREEKWEQTYRQDTINALKEYSSKLESKDNQSLVLLRAYSKLKNAMRESETTPWLEEAYARNMRIAAEVRKNKLEQCYETLILKPIRGRKLKKEMKSIDHIINDCKKIEEKALKEMNL